MSAFANVVAAVENVTRIRRRLATKVIADCPLCSRKRRLEVQQLPSGAVVFICHAGCDREALRDRIGLDWREFFENVPYRPAPRRSAAQHVLHAVTGTRWTIVTHAFARGDRDLAFAVEIVERLLPARHAARDLLRLKAGTPIAWDEFPLTAGFVMDIARKLGEKVGEHRAYRLIRLLVEHGLIEHIDPLPVVDEQEFRLVPIFRLGHRARRLRHAQDTPRASELRASPSSNTDPATWTVLSSPDLVSTPRGEVEKQLRAARDAVGALGRSPPARLDVERWR